MTARGTKTTLRPRITRDEQTGREVRIVSPEGVASSAPYMYINAFSPEERFLFFAFELSGCCQLYRLDLSDNTLTQVTDAKDCRWHGWNIHPSEREIFYFADGCYRAANLDTLEDRLVFDPHAHNLLNVTQQIMFSASGRWLSFSYRDADNRSVIARAECSGSGEWRDVYRREENEHVQHLMFANVDDDLMSFSPAPDHQQEWDAPWAWRARTYLVDARDGAVEPFLVLPKPFTATHDYWSPAGDRMYYHKKTRPTWVPTWICALDRHTREERIIYGNDRLKLGHSFVTRDEKWIVSDVQEPNNNPLLLIETATGRERVLCWPNSTVSAGNSQESHVHPSFSPRGTYVLYTSDASGVPQVHLVPVPEVA